MTPTPIRHADILNGWSLIVYKSIKKWDSPSSFKMPASTSLQSKIIWQNQNLLTNFLGKQDLKNFKTASKKDSKVIMKNREKYFYKSGIDEFTNFVYLVVLRFEKKMKQKCFKKHNGINPLSDHERKLMKILWKLKGNAG